MDIMKVFPGMTPAAVWDLPFLEWIIVATASDRAVAERATRG